MTAYHFPPSLQSGTATSGDTCSTSIRTQGQPSTSTDSLRHRSPEQRNSCSDAPGTSPVGERGLHEHQTGRLPSSLSGGQLQRAALARALLARPAVLICDEITSGLDTLSQSELLTVLTHARSTTGTAVVVISHDLPAISALADEVCVLDHGRCVELAPLHHLLTQASSPVAHDLITAARRGARRNRPEPCEPDNCP